jgi:hypothetical protein
MNNLSPEAIAILQRLKDADEGGIDIACQLDPITHKSIVDAERLCGDARTFIESQSRRIAELEHANNSWREQFLAQPSPPPTAELDWNRLLAGDRRALDPAHQAIFDKLAAVPPTPDTFPQSSQMAVVINYSMPHDGIVSKVFIGGVEYARVKPPHEREPPHCSTCECGHEPEPYCTCPPEYPMHCGHHPDCVSQRVEDEPRAVQDSPAFTKDERGQEMNTSGLALELIRTGLSAERYAACMDIIRKGPFPAPENIQAIHEQLARDQVAYGVSYVRTHLDGTVARIDPATVIIAEQPAPETGDAQ